MPALVTSVGLFRSEAETTYSYPAHLSESQTGALPAAPGVYIFEDERGRPLYIGKSINIRGRVLAHLRAPAEARMLQQSRRISHQRTAGEIGALLLESRLIKDLQPVHNKRLRRTREMCAFRIVNAVPELVYARDIDFATTNGLYGLFATRRAAFERLQTIVDTHRLCRALCGLEAAARGRPCFASQLGRCAGACCGRETAAEHARRLCGALEQLRVETWPFAGAIGIVESDHGWRQMHVIDRWFYRGTVEEPFDSPHPDLKSRCRFDADTYAILVRPLMLGQLQLVDLSQALNR